MEEFSDIVWRDGRFASLPFHFPRNNFQLFYVFRIDVLPRVLQEHQSDRYW